MEIVIDSAALVKYTLYFIFALTIALLVLIAIWQLLRFLRRPELIDMDREGIKRRWEEIELMLRKHGEITDKIAILEADKLLDQVLKSMTMPGQTMGERLKVACFKYPRLQNVWWAHKLRNQLVHESSFSVSHKTARAAVRSFERALKMLGLL